MNGVYKGKEYDDIVLTYKVGNSLHGLKYSYCLRNKIFFNKGYFNMGKKYGHTVKRWRIFKYYL